MSLEQQQAPAGAPEQPVETISRVDWAPVPRVNLLPKEILERRRFRVFTWRLALLVVVAIALVTAGTVWSQMQVNKAQNELTATESRTSELQNEQGQYAQVPLTYTKLEAAKDARAQAMSDDVLWYSFLNELAVTMPSSVSLTTMTSTLGADSQSSQTPLTTPGIGMVTLTGTAGSDPDVAAWMDSVAKVTGVGSVTLQTATRDTGGAASEVTFTAQLVLTDAALSHRYDQKAS